VIILYNPPSSASRKPVLPMSLLALGAVLEGKHDYTIVDGNLEKDPLSTLDRAIAETKATLLGVTVMPGPQLNHAVPLCRRIKAMHPQLTVVWGGYFPTQHWDVCLKADFVDFVVRGHGELLFKGLLDVLERGDDPGVLAGLAYRDPRTGKVAANDVTPLPHPEWLPSYPHHRIATSRYIRATFLGRRTLPHHSSYGCPFTCGFCAVVNMACGRWLAQSARRTASEVHHLVERWAVDAVEFYDNNFFVHEERTAEFAERIADLGIHWWGEARVDTLMGYDDRTWELMRDSGLKMVFVGAESGSDDTLERMNKGGRASSAQTLAFARKAASYGIVPEMSFVLGNPPDAEADARQTMSFIRELKRVHPQTEIVLYVYTPVPLTGELYDQSAARGFRFPETLDEWVSPSWREFSQRRGLRSPWLDTPLRRRIRGFQQVLNAYYPTSTDARLRGARRFLLRFVSAWRYHLGIYRFPIELRILSRVLPYQRPETSGF
jgi:radical SAM superfamily enzyme YgiQ (UPF0313 family)